MHDDLPPFSKGTFFSALLILFWSEDAWSSDAPWERVISLTTLSDVSMGYYLSTRVLPLSLAFFRLPRHYDFIRSALTRSQAVLILRLVIQTRIFLAAALTLLKEISFLSSAYSPLLLFMPYFLFKRRTSRVRSFEDYAIQSADASLLLIDPLSRMSLVEKLRSHFFASLRGTPDDTPAFPPLFTFSSLRLLVFFFFFCVFFFFGLWFFSITVVRPPYPPLVPMLLSENPLCDPC